MRIVRGALLALAVGGVCLLALVVLNRAEFGATRLVRFREITLAIEGALLLFALLRADRGAWLSGWVGRLERFLGSAAGFRASMAVMLALFVASALTQHAAYRTGSHDFSMIDEALHQSLEGRFLFSPVLGKSFLSEHFSPILALLIPAHAVFPDPLLLVLAQPLALWASAIALRALWREEGASPAAAHLAALLYLNHAILVSTLDYLFHMECLLPLLLFQAFRGRRGPPWRYALWLLLALCVKEDVGLYVAGLGAWLALAERRRALGVATAVAGVAWSLAALRWWIPAFAPPDQGYAFLGRWSHWGDGGLGVLRGMLADPGALLAAAFSKPILVFSVSALLLPFASRWGWLLVAAPWLLNATSALPAQSKLLLYYGIPLLAFGAIAAAPGLRAGFWGRLPSQARLALVAFAVVWNVSHLVYPAIPPHGRAIARAIAAIPDSITVQLQPCLYPRAGYQQSKRVLWIGDAAEERYVALRADAATWPFTPVEADSFAQAALDSGRYRNRSAIPHFYLLERHEFQGGPPSDRGDLAPNR